VASPHGRTRSGVHIIATLNRQVSTSNRSTDRCPHQPVAVLGWCSYMAILKSCLSNIFWSGFTEGDATVRVRESTWITDLETRVQAGSNQSQIRHVFAFWAQPGSKPKTRKAFVFIDRRS